MRENKANAGHPFKSNTRRAALIRIQHSCCGRHGAWSKHGSEGRALAVTAPLFRCAYLSINEPSTKRELRSLASPSAAGLPSNWLRLRVFPFPITSPTRSARPRRSVDTRTSRRSCTCHAPHSAKMPRSLATVGALAEVYVGSEIRLALRIRTSFLRNRSVLGDVTVSSFSRRHP